MQEHKTRYEKEGQLQTSISAVIQLVTGVGVAVLVLIFVGALSGQTYNLVEPDIDEIAQSVTNQSVTVLNSTAVSLGQTSIVGDSIVVRNASETIANSQFTFELNAGTVTLLNNTWNNTALLFSYTHGNLTVEESVRGGVISGFEALEQTGDYLPIIVLAVVIALVLALVLGMSALSGNRGNGGQRTAL